MSKLKIGPGLQLPEEAVTQTFAILAKRGVGKTYTALVMAEEMLENALPVVVVDPIGVSWGLRSSADGRDDGYPIAVFGGDHGDLPLEKGAGQLIADLVIDERLSCVLDLGGFRKGEQISFMTAFAERLYHRNRAPLHLILDEADAFAPQRTMRGVGAERLLGAIEDIVRRGRARGLGCTLISQRPAVLNKNVLTQIETLVAMRIVSPQDRQAINEWVKVYGEGDDPGKVMNSLAELDVGESWWWSPGWLGLLKKVRVRERRTFDSSSTPKAGERPIEPRTLSDVDVEELRERMAATVEQAEANDPRVLRKRIAELERELAKAPEAVEPERVEVEVATMPAFVPSRVVDVRGVVRAAADHAAAALKAVEEFHADVEAMPDRSGQVRASDSSTTPEVKKSEGRPTPPAEAQRRTQRQAAAAAQNGSISPARARILDALAWFEALAITPRRAALAPMAGTKATSGGFKNNLGALRTQELVDYPARGQVTALPVLFLEEG